MRYFQTYLIASVCLLAFIGCSVSMNMKDLAKSPPHHVQNTPEYATSNSFQRDFLYLTETLKETHPAFDTISTERYETDKREFMQLLAQETTLVGFRVAVQKFLSRLRDSHTTVLLDNIQETTVYPIGLVWMRDSLFIAGVGDSSDLDLIGHRVLALNSTPLAEALRKLSPYTSYENFSYIRWRLRDYLTSPYYLNREGIIRSDTLTLTISSPDSEMRTLELVPAPFRPLIYTYKKHAIASRRRDAYWHTIIPEDSLCYLQFNRMFDRRELRRLGFFNRIVAYSAAWIQGFGNFEDYLEEMLSEMHQKGVKTLVVDLRGNGGGNSRLGDQLLYYLNVPPQIRGFSSVLRVSPLFREIHPEENGLYSRWYSTNHHGTELPDTTLALDPIEQSWNPRGNYFSQLENEDSDIYTPPLQAHFTGQVYFIIGEGTYSSANLLATIVKDNHLFPLVGQPSGQPPSHYGDILTLRLPESDTYCFISSKKWSRPDQAKDNELTLQPDTEIWLTFDEFQNGTDPVFDWILNAVRAEDHQISNATH